MSHPPAEPVPAQTLPNRWRHVSIAIALVLSVAWVGLGLAYLARPATAADLTTTKLNYRIHLNHDDAAHLRLLSGIGPRLADRIITHRQQVGPFASPEQLKQVHHIGPRLVERIEPWTTLAAPPSGEP